MKHCSGGERTPVKKKKKKMNGERVQKRRKNERVGVEDGCMRRGADSRAGIQGGSSTSKLPLKQLPVQLKSMAERNT